MSNIKEIYLHYEDFILILHDDDTVGRTLYDFPEYFLWTAPFRCDKCKALLILNGEMEHYQSIPRAMGNEMNYGGTDVFECPCGNEIEIETLVNYYATSWFCDFDCNGATLTRIHFLWDIIHDLHNAKIKVRVLSNEKKFLDYRLKTLVDHALKTRGYVLIVEGNDDEEIWNQFLRRNWNYYGNIDISRINIAKYGSGGIDAAIKATKYFKGRVLKAIPHKLILDSDNKKDEKIKLLKKNGIAPSKYHILDLKEIESYLFEAQAISKIITVDKKRIDEDLNNFKPIGKEQLDAIFKKHLGRNASSSEKGLIARALKELPLEIKTIIKEIIVETTKLDDVIYDTNDTLD